LIVMAAQIVVAGLDPAIYRGTAVARMAGLCRS
jgi:hypothetical protein